MRDKYLHFRYSLVQLPVNLYLLMHSFFLFFCKANLPFCDDFWKFKILLSAARQFFTTVLNTNVYTTISFAYNSFQFWLNCHSMMPIVTETFNECLVPNCGISMQSSTICITSSDTPCTSFPNINAYLLSVCIPNCCKGILSTACSIARTV